MVRIAPRIDDREFARMWRELARPVTFSICVRYEFSLNRKSANFLGNGAPGRTRTCDPRLRRAVVLLRSRFVLSDLGRYPRELPTRSVCDVGVRCEARPHLRGK